MPAFKQSSCIAPCFSNCRQVLALWRMANALRWFLLLGYAAWDPCFYAFTTCRGENFMLLKPRDSTPFSFRAISSSFAYSPYFYVQHQHFCLFLWLSRIRMELIDFLHRGELLFIFLFARIELLYFSMKNDWINAEKQPATLPSRWCSKSRKFKASIPIFRTHTE